MEVYFKLPIDWSILAPFQWRDKERKEKHEVAVNQNIHRISLSSLSRLFILTIKIENKIQSNQTTAEKPDADHRWKIESDKFHYEYWEELVYTL